MHWRSFASVFTWHAIFLARHWIKALSPRSIVNLGSR
jgi:hypothetical protein